MQSIHGRNQGLRQGTYNSYSMAESAVINYAAKQTYYDNKWPQWLVGWGLTALLTQNRSYRACMATMEML